MPIPLRALGLVAGGLVAGCTVVGPDFEAPTLDLPASYSAPIPEVFEGGAAIDPWWQVFDEPLLTRLIEQGLQRNLGIRIAASRLREARALAQSVVARTGPEVVIGGDGTIDERLSEEDGRQGLTASASGTLDLAYEIDLFGGLARTRQAALAEAARTERLRAEAGRLTAAEIARAYVQLRLSQRQLGLTNELLELQRRTLALTRERVATGLAPGLDEVRALAVVASLEARLGPLQAAAATFRNALSVLLAEPPGGLAKALDTPSPIPVVEAGPAVGVPRDLLRRRPDIQAAELALVAATAEIGIATAELYPSLTLPGSIVLGPVGFGARDLVASVLASISLAVGFPLFDGGEREAELTAAEERTVQAGLLYRDTVLRALQEVDAALLAYEGSRARRAALVRAVASNRRAFELSQQLYRQGLASFIDVLDSQRAFNTSLDDLANAEGEVAAEVVNLLSALGGSPPHPTDDASPDRYEATLRQRLMGVDNGAD